MSRNSEYFASACLLLSLGCSNVLGLRDDYYVAGDGEPSVASLELPAGKLVFQQFSDYFAGDARMWVTSLPDGAKSAELGEAYGLCSPLNGNFSPDGRFLVLAATPRAGACKALDRNALEVYELDLERPGNKRQLTNNAVPDEDAIYEPGGDVVLFKHNGNLSEMARDGEPFTMCDALSPGAFCFDNSAGEQSRPAIDADRTTICYYEGQQAEADVFCFERALGLAAQVLTSIRKPAAAHKNVLDARPVIQGDFLYYSRWRASNNQALELWRKPLGDLPSEGERAAFCTDLAASYMDPAELEPGVLVFSSDHTGLGGRDLFVARFAETAVLPLDAWLPGSSSTLEDVGAAFWAAP